VSTRVLKSGQRTPAIETRQVRALGDQMLRALGLERAELSVLLTDDQGIQQLNRDHLGEDRPTDVLAFPLDALDREAPVGDRLLGDVVISLYTAARQAKGRKRPLLEEVRFLLAHGLLHLVGYDHATAGEKREMTAMTRRLVRAAPLAAPRRRPKRPARR
jgi:probable rRNA maturation factor